MLKINHYPGRFFELKGCIPEEWKIRVNYNVPGIHEYDKDNILEMKFMTSNNNLKVLNGLACKEIYDILIYSKKLTFKCEKYWKEK